MPMAQKGKQGNLSDYLHSRSSSIAFATILVAGLASSSAFCAANGEVAQLLHSMVLDHLSSQLTLGYPSLLLSALYGFGGIFVYIYLCISSRKGALLIYAVPLVHGLSIGTMVSAILLTQGYGAVAYLLVCIFLPKAVETLLLLSICNKTVRYCKEQQGGGSSRKRRESFPILLYLILFIFYFVLETFVILLFRWLL